MMTTHTYNSDGNGFSPAEMERMQARLDGMTPEQRATSHHFRPAGQVAHRAEVVIRNGQIDEQTSQSKWTVPTAYVNQPTPGMVSIGGMVTSVDAAKASGVLPPHWQEGDPLPFDKAPAKAPADAGNKTGDRGACRGPCSVTGRGLSRLTDDRTQPHPHPFKRKENIMMTPLTSPAPLTIPEICRNVPFMTSLEIAEITGRHHMNVRQDFKGKLEKMGEDVSRFEAVYLDKLGRPQPCYALPGDYLLPLVAPFRVIAARERIIQHWSARNNGTAAPVKGAPTSFVGKLLEDARAGAWALVSRLATRAVMS